MQPVLNVEDVRKVEQDLTLEGVRDRKSVV